MTSLFIFNSSATAKGADVVLSFADGSPYPLNMRRYIFYCDAPIRYREITEGVSASVKPLAPRSMGTKVSGIVCAKVGPTIAPELKSSPRPPQHPLRRQDYCKGFSEEACGRIRQVVEATITPDYCKPGFAVVPTKLSGEQLRICSIMPRLKH